MTLASGGTYFKGRRKRGKAARLQPVAEDAASTTRLFDGTRAVVHGARPVAADTAARPDHSVTTTHGLDRHGAADNAPRLRYEWRSATGEVLVVEAGIPEGASEVAPAAAPPVRLASSDGLDLRR